MGILEFHAAVVGQLQLKGDNELSASIMIGGGITIGVPFIKSSFYVQGNVEITGKFPSATKGAVEGLKWLLVQWADKQKENSAFGKLLKTLSSAHKAKGADKLKEVSTKIRQRLKSPDASEKKDGNSGSFDVEEYKFDKIIEDGHKKFIELTIAYKEKAAEMLAELKKKAAGKKMEAYTLAFERIWRGVYMNDPTNVGEKFWNARPKCTKIAGTVLTIQPLMCTFFKYGELTTDSHDPSKGNANTRKMFPLAYPELFPEEAKLEGLLDAIVKRNKLYKDAIAKTKDADFKARLQARLDLKIHTGLFVNNMYATGLTPLLAVKPDELHSLVTDMTKNKNTDECLKACTCGITEIKLEGQFGVTLGASAVGFCTPDSNPVQFIAGASYVWKKEEDKKSGKCLLARSDDSGSDLTLTIAASSYLALAVTWKFDMDSKYTGFKVELRLRLPWEKPAPKPEEIVPATETKNVATFAEALEKAVQDISDAQGSGIKKVEDAVKAFFVKVQNAISAKSGTAGLLPSMTGSMGGKVAKSVFALGAAVFKDEAKKMVSNMSPIAKTGLQGFDFEYEKKGKAVTKKISFDHLTISEAKANAPVMPGVIVGSAGYFLEGKRIELEF